MRQTLLRFTKKSTLTLALAFGLIMPLATNTVSAADLFNGAKGEACAGVQLRNDPPAGDDLKKCTSDDETTLTNTLTTILNLLTMVVGIMTVIMLIISGIRFITAHGDANSISSARNTLIYAIVGLVIVAFAQVIVKLVLARIGK